MPRRPVAVVIEDQVELSGVLRDVLRHEGFDVVVVDTVAKAHPTLRERTVAVVVVDLPSDGAPDDVSIQSIVEGFPQLGIVVVRDPDDEPPPFFGPWRTEGSKRILRRPFRLDDLLGAVRDIYPH
jgi:DNA-binding NtrC family response regulator